MTTGSSKTEQGSAKSNRGVGVPQWYRESDYRRAYNVCIALSVERRRLFKTKGVALLLVCAHPLILNAVLHVFQPAWAVTGLHGYAWLSAFCLINLLMLVAAAHVWTFMTTRINDINDLLQSRDNHALIREWFESRLSVEIQSIPSVIGIVGGLVFLWFTREAMTEIMDIGLASFIMVAFTGFVGGNTCYWLWTAPGILKKLYQCSALGVRWHDPASTPGIRLLADGLALAAVLLLAGTITISMAGFVFTGTIQLSPLQWLLAAFFALVFLTSIRVGIYPFIWMYAIVARAKRNTLTELNRHIPELKQLTRSPGAKSLTFIDIYSHIARSPYLPFNTTALVQYTAALLGAAIAFVAGFLV